MLSDMSLFQIYGAMARHAAESQKTSAENLARANEPGFKAVEIESFSDFMQRNGPSIEQIDFNQSFQQSLSKGAASPNGNTVSVEQEVFRSAEASNQHQMALTVYTKSIEMMRLALGRRN
ncbi:MAG: flagellar biosynthesis protein FlgB [Hyphomonadaceae bacterium]|nr:flagellar biosynthesis protein FlgB [Hyphomonadaceae bacterium]